MVDLLLFYMLIALIWWLFAFLFKDYSVDCTRQRLFNIRDELFDCAAREEINFNDEAYIITRTMLNGAIRFAHTLSVTQFMVIALVAGKKNKEYSADFISNLDMSIKKLTKHQQAIIKGAIFKMHIVVFLHLLNTSLLLFPVFFMFKILFRLFAAIKLNEKIGHSTLWNAIDAQANLIGRA